MSKSKAKSYRAQDRDYWDGMETDLRHVREEKNRRREKRVQNALRSKNVAALVDIDEEGMIDPIDYDMGDIYDQEMVESK